MWEKIFDGDKYLGIVHESYGNWYVTAKLKNLSTTKYSTCSTGIVRFPKPKNEAMTFPNRGAAVTFLKFILSDV